ncbi:carbohydrate-binding protein [Adhaeribacter pallidiroseus]|uniref:Carbohydrate-binding protein n=1 Tax=Adhaeribacter pallidiroseus TaxID=2072847 RepID=A0A369QHL4_9BACT|nr:carbohydrate-binding protein [Adhaeribacter pallidiroseus]RDC64403.1 hypothetical protein AHMF7616_03017 [Adhaeribacter pallidiroseus]
MRKQIIEPAQPRIALVEPNWLDLEQLVQLELTSEAETHLIEAAFTPNENEGWRAGQPGKQTIRLIFEEPHHIKQIRVVFQELAQARTQEFLLSWLSADGLSYQEIVRQQYNFNPPATCQQVEEYTVDLKAVKALELTINPDISNPGAYASLAHLQLGG